MTKLKSTVAPETLNWYKKLVETLPRVSLKGATIPYTAVNGNMFSNVAKSGHVSLRLPSEAREEFLKKYKTTLAEEYGVVRPEYVVVPDALLKKTKELSKYFEIS